MASIDISEERGVRYLHFGSHWIQGAMRIARPWALELEYTRELMLPLVFRPGRDWPASVLQVGLGSASVTKFLYRNRPGAKITVVEIGDGHDYLAVQDRQFDLIVVDGFDSQGRSGALDMLPFYVNCRARLAPDGLMAVNLLTRRKGVKASTERMREAFDDRVLVLPPSEPGNIVALASAGEPIALPIEDLRDCALALKAETGLNLLPTLARLQLTHSPALSGSRR